MDRIGSPLHVLFPESVFSDSDSDSDSDSRFLISREQGQVLLSSASSSSVLNRSLDNWQIATTSESATTKTTLLYNTSPSTSKTG